MKDLLIGTVGNFYIEYDPGEGISGSIQEAKGKIIERLSANVAENPSKAKFVTEDPHFTMWCNRASNVHKLYVTLRDSPEFTRDNASFSYVVEGSELQEYEDDFFELRAKIAAGEVEKFREVQQRIIPVVATFRNTGDHEWFNPSGADPDIADHIVKYGYPNSADRFKPHASVGRFHKSVLPKIQDIVDGWDPSGTYTLGDLVMGVLPFTWKDPTNKSRKVYGSLLE